MLERDVDVLSEPQLGPDLQHVPSDGNQATHLQGRHVADQRNVWRAQDAVDKDKVLEHFPHHVAPVSPVTSGPVRNKDREQLLVGVLVSELAHDAARDLADFAAINTNLLEERAGSFCPLGKLCPHLPGPILPGLVLILLELVWVSTQLLEGERIDDVRGPCYRSVERVVVGGVVVLVHAVGLLPTM